MDRTSVNQLPEGRTLVITADNLTTGTLTWQDGSDDAVTIGASTVQRFGPFETARNYTLKHVTGELAESQEFSHKISGRAGLNCNLTNIPATENLTVPTNSQCVIYGDITLTGTVDVDGELKII
jgi:hypothetical protein